MIVYKALSPFNSTCIKPGETLDFINFQIDVLSFIDEGASKKCWKAFYSISGKKYLKAVLVHTSVRTEKDIASVINEIAVHRLLEGHPAIIYVDQSLVIRANKALYWIQVMHLYNSTLFTAIKYKFFIDFQVVLDVLDQLSKGMAYIHSKGIVLGDVKPGNILFEEGTIKYTDFGGADYKDNSENTQTWDYRAPEGFVKPQNSFKTNVWSLGIIFALTVNNKGTETPYDKCRSRGKVTYDSYKLATSIFVEQIKSIKGITDIIVAMMDLDPSKRPTADGVLKSLRFPKAVMPIRKDKP